MYPGPSEDELRAAIERLEDAVDDLHLKLDNTNRGRGGIGCLGFALFVFVLVKLDAIEELVKALSDS